jgi:hypothetical protein
MVFSNVNNISFGLSGSTRMTASFDDRLYEGALQANQAWFQGTVQMRVDSFYNDPLFFPYMDHGDYDVDRVAAGPLPGKFLVGIIGGTTSTNATSSFAHTWKLGLYSLNNGTQLNLFNSASLVISQSGVSRTNSQQDIQALYFGLRYLTFGQSAFSNSTDTYRGQFWAALMVSVAGQSLPHVSWVGQTQANSLGAGIAGISRNTNLSKAFVMIPMYGQRGAVTAAFPTAVVSSNITSNSANLSGFMPGMAHMDNVLSPAN